MQEDKREGCFGVFDGFPIKNRKVSATKFAVARRLSPLERLCDVNDARDTSGPVNVSPSNLKSTGKYGRGRSDDQIGEPTC